MSTINIQLYDIFRKELNLSEDKARVLTQTIEQVVKNEVKVESHEYKSIFKDDFKEIDTKLSDLNAKLEREITRLDGSIEVKIAQSKADMIKWFVSLFVALALMILGLYIKK